MLIDGNPFPLNWYDWGRLGVCHGDLNKHAIPGILEEELESPSRGGLKMAPEGRRPLTFRARMMLSGGISPVWQGPGARRCDERIASRFPNLEPTSRPVTMPPFPSVHVGTMDAPRPCKCLFHHITLYQKEKLEPQDLTFEHFDFLFLALSNASTVVGRGVGPDSQ